MKNCLFVSVLILLLAAEKLEPRLQPTPSELPRYAWIDTKNGKCVGLIVREGGKTVAYFGDNDRLPSRSTISEDLRRFPAGALVGEKMRTASGAEGVVRKAFGAPITNRETLVLDTGEHGNVAGACAAPY